MKMTQWAICTHDVISPSPLVHRPHKMCWFSPLADPFYYTLLLTALYALIAKLGYSRSSELIYSSFLSVFGRGDYKKFMENWKELKAAKGEVKKVSAQDEFAKWAKLQRKVDKLQSDFDKQYSSRQKSLLAVQFVGSIVLRVICYISSASFLYFNASKSVFSLDLFKKEIEAVPFAEKLLAFPSAQVGELSVPVWTLVSYIAMRELFDFL